jgi:hypothetical protein
LQDDATGTGQSAGIDHHIAGNQQTSAAFGPGFIELDDGVRGQLARSGELLFHGGLGNAVGKAGAVGQLESGKEKFVHGGHVSG